MTTRTRSAARQEWLGDVLVTALAHNGYGFSEDVELHFPDGKPGEWFAVIIDRYTEKGDEDYGKQYRVDLDTMAKGLGVLRKVVKPAPWVKELLVADRTNGEDGGYDVIGALAVLECGLFGDITYG